MTIFFITILAAMALHSLYLISNLFLGFATNKTILSSINITRIAFIFILRLQFSNGQVRTLNKLTKLTKNDLKYIIDLLNDKVQSSQDGYKTMPLNAIIKLIIIPNITLKKNIL